MANALSRLWPDLAKQKLCMGQMFSLTSDGSSKTEEKMYNIVGFLLLSNDEESLASLT